MTVTSEYIEVEEGNKYLKKEVLTSKVFDNSFLKMEVCKDKNSDDYDSYKFTNQDRDIFICRTLELTELLLYFKGLNGTTNGISISMRDSK